MAVSESKKKANMKWDSANMATLACKVKKEQAEQFKTYCAGIGETVNAVLQSHVVSCINSSTLQDFVEWPQSNEKGVGDILTPRAKEIAQRAAEMAGETMPEFVERAVDTQAKRDKAAFVLERAKRKAPEDSGT